MSELVRVIDAKVQTTSLLVAEAFGKRHDHVLRTIDNLREVDPACALNFEETSLEVPMPKGGKRQVRYFVMDEEGFLVLALGFTGDKAIRMRGAFVREFRRLQAIVDGRTVTEVIRDVHSQVLAYRETASPEARDTVAVQMSVLRQVGNQKGSRAWYSMWLEMGWPRVEDLEAKFGLLPTPALPERPMATVALYVEDAGVRLSGTTGTHKADLWSDYQVWASNHGCRFMEPTAFYRQVREHFEVETRQGVFPLAIARASAFG